MIRRIQDDKVRLNRTNLEFIVSGFKENLIVSDSSSTSFQSTKFNHDLFRDHSESAERSRYLEHVIENRADLVGYIPWPLSLSLNDLTRFVDKKKSSILKKFNLYSIYGISGVAIDSSDLIRLFRENDVENVRLALPLAAEKFTAQFCRQLYSIQSIKELTLECPLESIEFDWLLNLQNLQVLDLTTEKICLDSVCKATEQLKFLYSLTFVTEKF